MDITVSFDKQGRSVLPSHIREALGLKDGGHVSIGLNGQQVILEPRSDDLEKQVQEWKSLLSIKAEAFSEELKETWKWMSREYARRKLCLA